MVKMVKDGKYIEVKRLSFRFKEKQRWLQMESIWIRIPRMGMARLHVELVKHEATLLDEGARSSC